MNTRSGHVAYRWKHRIVFVWGIGASIAGRDTKRYLTGISHHLSPMVALLSGWGLWTIWRLTPIFGGRQTVWLAVVLEENDRVLTKMLGDFQPVILLL